MKTKPVNHCPVPKGILIAIGGKENKGEDLSPVIFRTDQQKLEILKVFLDNIPQTNPHIEIITTASSEGDELFSEYLRAFKELQIEHINRIHHENREQLLSNEYELCERIKAADGIYFSGGDQLKLTTIYGGSKFLFDLKQQYIHRPIVIAGTSAGAMALSTPMIYAGNKDVQQISGEIKVTTGLEFLKDVCIDTHFVDRSRVVRMAQVIATNPTCIGIGIEENTGLIIRNGIEATICGSGVVMMMDGFGIQNSNLTAYNTDAIVSIRGMQFSLLSRGDSFTIPQSNPPHI